MKGLEYFGYICIGFFTEVFAAVAGVIVATWGLSLPIFQLAMLLPIVIGVFLFVCFGRVHRYCRSAILWRLVMGTRVYSAFAQILPIIGIIVVYGVLVNIAVKSHSLGGVAVLWIGLVGAGVAVFSAVAGWAYRTLPPDKFKPNSTSEQISDEKTEV